MSEIQRYEFATRINHAVKHNGVVYLTGQTGTPGKSVTEQTKEVLDKIDNLLKLAGTDKSRILNVILWLDDMRDFDAVNELYDAWMPMDNASARSAGQVRMTHPGMLVELIVTAAAD